jgi:hypothetical protein
MRSELKGNNMEASGRGLIYGSTPRVQRTSFGTSVVRTENWKQDDEECRLVGCGAVYILCEPMFTQTTWSTRRHIPEDAILHSHRCEEHKSYMKAGRSKHEVELPTARPRTWLLCNIHFQSWMYYVKKRHSGLEQGGHRQTAAALVTYLSFASWRKEKTSETISCIQETQSSVLLNGDVSLLKTELCRAWSPQDTHWS